LQEFDITLKTLLQLQLQQGALSTLTGLAVQEWLSTDLPEIRARHVDLLGRSLDGSLVHVELQSSNDPDMALRMAEYAFDIHRAYGSFPVQLVLYVGRDRLRMKSAVTGPGFHFQCRIVDIRDLDPEPLLASPLIEDNILAMLTRPGENLTTIRTILRRIEERPPAVRNTALNQIVFLSGLRQCTGIIEREISHMPILMSLMDHELLGPVLRRGREQGLQEGREEGRLEGERRILVKQLTSRFGTLPDTYHSKLVSLDLDALDRISTRILDARTLEDVFSA
jgi:predicted transposase YdaD